MKMRDGRGKEHEIQLFAATVIWGSSDLGHDTNFSALTPSN